MLSLTKKLRAKVDFPPPVLPRTPTEGQPAIFGISTTRLTNLGSSIDFEIQVVEDLGEIRGVANGKIFYNNLSLLWPRCPRAWFNKFHAFARDNGELFNALQGNLIGHGSWQLAIIIL